MSEQLIITPEADGERLALPDGTASLRFVRRLGLRLPRYHFHVGQVVHAAQELGLFCMQTTLLLGNDLTGFSELCDFRATTDAGAGITEPVESLTRLIAAAVQHVESCTDHGGRLIAELPGWRNDRGISPVWQALGARFFQGDAAAAEVRLGEAWRTHLAALLPRQTIYLSFLGAEAEACLAKHSASPVPVALAIAFARAGFDASSHVRIDDGGPVFSRRLTVG